MVSRQFKRRMDRLKVNNVKKYGSVRKCPFDDYPCERKPSPIDGDRECFGVFGDRGEGEVVFVPPCSRLPPSVDPDSFTIS